MIVASNDWVEMTLVSHQSSLFAYVGPGLGLSLLAALWAVIVTLFTAIGAILYWPIRLLVRRSKRKHRMSYRRIGSSSHNLEEIHHKHSNAIESSRDL